MAPRTDADLAQLTDFAAKADQAAATLEAMRKKLSADLAELEGYWLGAGGNAFRPTKATVEREALRMTLALSGLGADVLTAGRNYDVADTQQDTSMKAVNAQTTGITDGLILT